MKVVLFVWPDGAWFASNDLPPAANSPIAKGTWSRNRDGKIVAESDAMPRTKKDRERVVAFCRAVCEVVTAMNFKGDV